MDLQHTMRSLIRGLPRLAFGGVPAERAGDARLACARLGVDPSELQLLADFPDGGPIPFESSADGGGIARSLRWTGVPQRARSLVLVVEDPDAPTPQPFVHWIVHDISPQAASIAGALSSGARVGRNSMLRAGWAGCAPPKGDRAHRYFFQLFALDRAPQLPAHAGRSAVADALAGHVIALGLLVGTYKR